AGLGLQRQDVHANRGRPRCEPPAEARARAEEPALLPHRPGPRLQVQAAMTALSTAFFTTRRLKERALLIAVVITTVVIVAFGVTQYRWSQEVTEAASVRLADTLQMSMVNWQIDLLRTFTDVTTTFASDGPAEAGHYVPKA